MFSLCQISSSVFLSNLASLPQSCSVACLHQKIWHQIVQHEGSLLRNESKFPISSKPSLVPGLVAVITWQLYRSVVWKCVRSPKSIALIYSPCVYSGYSGLAVVAMAWHLSTISPPPPLTPHIQQEMGSSLALLRFPCSCQSFVLINLKQTDNDASIGLNMYSMVVTRQTF